MLAYAFGGDFLDVLGFGPLADLVVIDQAVLTLKRKVGWEAFIS